MTHGGARSPRSAASVERSAMIVCHCMNITDHDIRAAVDWMRASDPETIVTPEKSITPWENAPIVVAVCRFSLKPCVVVRRSKYPCTCAA